MPLSLTLAIESLLLPMFIAAIILTLVVIGRLLFRSASRIEILIGVGSILISATGLLIHGISDYYTGVGFNEAAVFHLKHGLGGLGWGVLWPVVAVLVATVVMMVVLFELARRKRISRGDHLAAGARNIGKPMAGVYLVMLAINPALVQSAVMASHAANWDEYSRDIHAQMVSVDAGLVEMPEKPKSFVYLYAESFESAFIEDSRWPGLAPHMRAMESDPNTLSIRNLKQAPATGWTIAGMAASQCGFPAVANDFYAKTAARHGGATCIGDLLKQAGYTTSYMGGANLGFADKGAFYELHGFDRVFGDRELREQYPGKDMGKSDWGLYDDDLFDLALAEFDRLVAANNPFGLFMLTLDTHPHDGFENQHCKRMGRYTNDAGFDMLDAVHCSDRLIHEFIQAIRSRPGGEDVVIIVASDHLQSTNPNIRKQLGHEHDRRNLWMAQGPGIEGSKIDREATMFDIAPTMAQLLGMDVPALGLGRSLTEQSPTLIEQMGVSGLYVRLRSVFGGMGKSRDTMSEIRHKFNVGGSSPTNPSDALPVPTMAQSPPASLR